MLTSPPGSRVRRPAARRGASGPFIPRPGIYASPLFMDYCVLGYRKPSGSRWSSTSREVGRDVPNGGKGMSVCCHFKVKIYEINVSNTEVESRHRSPARKCISRPALLPCSCDVWVLGLYLHLDIIQNGKLHKSPARGYLAELSGWSMST